MHRLSSSVYPYILPYTPTKFNIPLTLHFYNWDNEASFMDNLHLVSTTEYTPNATKILIYSILGLSFSISFYLSLLGIIFSALAISLSNEYYRITHQLTKKVRVSRILSRIGLILGIVMSALLQLLILSVCISMIQ